ncbi:GIY-YIG nuclease family protein [Stenotrophomonas maltophilia]|uniref:GIY-YIG nuclease family protein n=2 Tax=Stenotrophomonas maltophilia TaxID=40324 RepID=UPI0009AD935D
MNYQTYIRRLMNWKRDQKYHIRSRTLYALVFENGHVYIGQTVDLDQRQKQHRSLRGGWEGKPFDVVNLGSVNATEAQASEYEYAWRINAAKAGWKIYAKPPGVTCDPWKRATRQRQHLAGSLSWQIPRRRFPFFKLAALIAAISIGASLLLTLAL